MKKLHLDARLREMALIQIGYAANCVYEYTHHIKTGLRYGVSPDDIRAIADGVPGCRPRWARSNGRSCTPPAT